MPNSSHPDNRFLQAETGPWGHLSPSPRSPTRTPAISPGAVSASSHLSPGASPGGPSPTSPAGPTGSRGPGPRQYRGRTSSMPAVPRHKVRIIIRISINWPENIIRYDTLHEQLIFSHFEYWQPFNVCEICGEVSMDVFGLEFCNCNCNFGLQWGKWKLVF